MIMTTGRVCTGTRREVSLHQRNVTEGENRMIKICATSSATEMHATGCKIDVRSTSILNRSSAEKGTMTTMIPIMTNLTEGGVM
jgi:hypothetical protein